MRRSRYHSQSHTFTFDQRRSALDTISNLEAQTIAVMVERPFTAHDVMEWLFPADVLRKCKDAYSVVHEPTTSVSYRVPFDDTMYARLWLSVFPNFDMLLPATHMLTVSDEAVPLLKAMHQASTICKEWNTVRTVLDWLDKNATPGAIRAYCPSLLTLIAPDNSPLFAASGDRYREPKDICGQLSALRSVAATIAAARLLPPTEPTKNYTIRFDLLFPPNADDMDNSWHTQFFTLV